MPKTYPGRWEINRQRQVIGRSAERHKTSNRSIITVSGPDKRQGQITAEAGENLVGGCLGCLFTDGKIYHASALNADGKPAMGFIKGSAGQGEKAQLITAGVYQASSTLDTQSSKIILRAGAPNWEQRGPARRSVYEDIYQYCGRPAGENLIFIDIRRPILLE